MCQYTAIEYVCRHKTPPKTDFTPCETRRDAPYNTYPPCEPQEERSTIEDGCPSCIEYFNKHAAKGGLGRNKYSLGYYGRNYGGTSQPKKLWRRAVEKAKVFRKDVDEISTHVDKIEERVAASGPTWMEDPGRADEMAVPVILVTDENSDVSKAAYRMKKLPSPAPSKPSKEEWRINTPRTPIAPVLVMTKGNGAIQNIPTPPTVVFRQEFSAASPNAVHTPAAPEEGVITSLRMPAAGEASRSDALFSVPQPNSTGEAGQRPSFDGEPRLMQDSRYPHFARSTPASPPLVVNARVVSVLDTLPSQQQSLRRVRRESDLCREDNHHGKASQVPGEVDIGVSNQGWNITLEPNDLKYSLLTNPLAKHPEMSVRMANKNGTGPVIYQTYQNNASTISASSSSQVQTSTRKSTPASEATTMSSTQKQTSVLVLPTSSSTPQNIEPAAELPIHKTTAAGSEAASMSVTQQQASELFLPTTAPITSQRTPSTLYREKRLAGRRAREVGRVPTLLKSRYPIISATKYRTMGEIPNDHLSGLKAASVNRHTIAELPVTPARVKSTGRAGLNYPIISAPKNGKRSETSMHHPSEEKAADVNQHTIAELPASPGTFESTSRAGLSSQAPTRKYEIIPVEIAMGRFEILPAWI